MRNVSLDEHLEAQAREAEHIEGLRRAMAEMLKAASQQTAAFHPHGSPAARSSQVGRRPHELTG
jgi:phage gpG-like protein